MRTAIIWDPVTGQEYTVHTDEARLLPNEKKERESVVTMTRDEMAVAVTSLELYGLEADRRPDDRYRAAMHLRDKLVMRLKHADFALDPGALEQAGIEVAIVADAEVTDDDPNAGVLITADEWMPLGPVEPPVVSHHPKKAGSSIVKGDKVRIADGRHLGTSGVVSYISDSGFAVLNVLTPRGTPRDLVIHVSRVELVETMCPKCLESVAGPGIEIAIVNAQLLLIGIVRERLEDELNAVAFGRLNRLTDELKGNMRDLKALKTETQAPRPMPLIDRMKARRARRIDSESSRELDFTSGPTIARQLLHTEITTTERMLDLIRDDCSDGDACRARIVVALKELREEFEASEPKEPERFDGRRASWIPG